jgi:prevent-host-death family protein
MSAVPDIIPISDLRRDAASVVKRATASGQPVFVTQRGRTTSVLLSGQAYLDIMRELDMRRIVAESDAAIAAGAHRDVSDVMADIRELLSRDD